MSTFLITGANRGIGLGLAKKLAGGGHRVIGTCRSSAKAGELSKIDGVEVQEVDMNGEAAMKLLADRLSGRPIDVLLNNAGVFPHIDSVKNMDADVMLSCVRTNAVGPMLLVKHLLPNLEKGERKVIVNFTSNLGSIELLDHAGSYAYNASKVALNMLTRILSFELKDKGFTCVAQHPGWVKTDMGGPDANLTIDECVEKLAPLFEQYGPSDNGRFVDPDGKDMPW